MVGRSAAAFALIGVLAWPAPAYAVTLEQRLAALSAFTQPTALSAVAWHGAWADPGSWTAYGFDWSTDLCSRSPDQPLGYDFRMPCARHDFGYRNYKAVNHFPANKGHVDEAFLYDMNQVCAGYVGARKAACDRLAWSYYQAVRRLGGFDLRTDPAV
ncbi:phospholipase A2-like protein [Nonomuraea fuscirosea]|uniref:Phospholipase A2-like protein n=1 Tax=Nonomuraea fuscirosea TaxID=1291556 RepID=A0A2T0LQR9_9ACTN|nr:phospholipase [Nonomuraea fuscirosea]PRX45736.1 phospholipase A2-like protein [Nonomuraea fuscirosea]